MNVLLTSVGRRVELVKEFKEIRSKLIPQCEILATDLNAKYSAACLVADRYFESPLVTDPLYPEYLIGLCKKNNISLIIPTIDTELAILANIKNSLIQKGIHVVSCSTEFVNLCRDKRKTANLFNSLGIYYPKIYETEHITFPAFCKPYDGSGSVGTKLIQSPTDLTSDLLKNPKNMFMEYVGKDFKEFTCDAYFDKDSSLKCLVPRERLEVRAGEVSKGVTRKNFVYEYLIQRLRKLPGAFGCVTLQVFGNPQNGEVKGLEVNPRFGGGYPLTSAAGCSFVELLIREYLLNEEASFCDDWTDGLVMLRYDAKVISRE
ncbi:ATP-grasp domain-containing protein [Candidatus Puniceispirillum sp.]|nr:ATP-grasp domain-containing protein [Candidatus Puniceispirillum sp.]